VILSVNDYFHFHFVHNIEIIFKDDKELKKKYESQSHRLSHFLMFLNISSSNTAMEKEENRDNFKLQNIGLQMQNSKIL